jgi:hypothetical protein
MLEVEIFKLLSDPTRLRIYKILLQTRVEAAVCEIMSAVNCIWIEKALVYIPIMIILGTLAGFIYGGL